MKKEIVNELLGYCKDSLVQGVEAIKVKFPVVCEQILKYELINNILVMILCIAICIILNCFIFKINKKAEEFFESKFTPALFAYIVVLIPAVESFRGLRGIIKILLAPDLYLLEYFSKLVKGG